MIKNKTLFFGTSEFSVDVLKTMIENGVRPLTIVTQPDKPKGRKMLLTPPPIKTWALENGYTESQILQPIKLDADFTEKLKNNPGDIELYILASYGKIIPKAVLDIPKYGTLNIHPSLLPKYRGSSPLQQTILNDDRHTGVTVMLMDELMDHGPIVAVKNIDDSELFWPPSVSDFSKMMAEVGANLLVGILQDWVDGKISAAPQNHDEATFTKKISKSDGEIKFSEDPYKNFLKIKAFEGWPGTYFFASHTKSSPNKIRIIIKKASFINGDLIIEKIIPEGKKEIDFKPEDWNTDL